MSNKMGEWHCPRCNNWVFRSKIQCRCGCQRDVSPMKPGDWTCPGCHGLVFASKDRCGKCYTFKPSVATKPNPVSNNDQFQNANPTQNNTNANSNNNMGGVGEVKRGDWRCSACNENNFASRQACYKCYKCRAAKPGNNVNMNAPQQPAQQSAKFAGDWNCNCGAQNFGSRVVCYKCATPRPGTSSSSSTN